MQLDSIQYYFFYNLIPTKIESRQTNNITMTTQSLNNIIHRLIYWIMRVTLSILGTYHE